MLAGVCASMLLSIMIANNVYAHPVGSCLSGCPVGGGTGIHVTVTNDTNVLTLLDFLRWLGMIAFFGSITFGIFVLFKNRTRKVAC
jgi:hypothetical protein